MLSLRQLEDVCMRDGGAEECRHLASDDQGKFYCLKKTQRSASIDREVAEFRSKSRAVGVDPKSLGLPMGDHCQGYIFFRHKMQGYDQA